MVGTSTSGGRGRASLMLAVVGAALAASAASATTTRVARNIVSQYRDGVWTGAGDVYSFYYNVGTPPNHATFPAGSSFELRSNVLNQAQVRTQYGNNTIGLFGYSLATGQVVNYGGAANNLVDHQANFGWGANYQLHCDNTGIDVTVAINYNWANSGLNPTQQTHAADVFETAIEGWWSDRYGIQTMAGTFPIRFDVTAQAYANGAAYDQNVNVLAGNSRANLSTWYVDADESVFAHEFGHMLGLYDEYWSGAIDGGTLTVDYNSIMGRTDNMSSGDGLRGYYFNAIRDWFLTSDCYDGLGTQIVVVPAPAGAGLLAIAGLLAVRRQRR